MTGSAFAHAHAASRRRLTPRDLPEFASDSLFDSLARLLCQADCVPRKELFESWAAAKRLLRRLKGGRVLDLAGGHGLVGWFVAITDRSTPEVLLLDRRLPQSAAKVHAALSARFPALGARVHRVEADLAEVAVASQDRVLAVHACGPLTDRVLDVALAARARVGVVPCCHATAHCDDGGLSGWLPFDVAVDVRRADRLRAAGYRVHTAQLPSAITPMGRVLIGIPTGSLQQGPTRRVGRHEPSARVAPVARELSVVTDQERNLAMVCHLGATAGTVLSVGFMGWVAPLAVLLFFSEDSDFVASHAKSALNFQVAVFGTAVLGAILAWCCVGIPILILLALASTILPIFGAIEASNRRMYTYPLTIDLF